MPVLPAEPGLFPEDLFNEPSVREPAGRLWWVLHTKPRQEKSLARYLYERQMSFYLPQIQRRWRLRNRPMTSHVPLFPSYVFLLADREERVTALTTNRVVRTLEVADQAQLWHDLRQVQRLIISGAPITPEDRLVPGATVEIRSGPLAGLKGKILRTATGRRFVVQVDFIQRGASVLLDDFTLEKGDE
jgi:transcriptional antiterminator RfaH